MIRELYNLAIKESKDSCDLRFGQMTFGLCFSMVLFIVLCIVLGIYGLGLVLFTEYGAVFSSVLGDYSRHQIEEMFLNTTISYVDLMAIKMWGLFSFLLKVFFVLGLILLFHLILNMIGKFFALPRVQNSLFYFNKKLEKIKQKTCRPINIEDHLL